MTATRPEIKKATISKESELYLRIQSTYNNKYTTLLEEDKELLPRGTVIHPTAFFRTVSGAGVMDHLQLIHYEQPLLGNYSTHQYLQKITDENNKDVPEEIREYVKHYRTYAFMYFPFAFQIAYDVYMTGRLSDKVYELQAKIDERYCKIMESLK